MPVFLMQTYIFNFRKYQSISKMALDDYSVLCQDAHKMISSCFEDVQCKNCSKRGHLRINCPQDSSTNANDEVENKSTRFELDCETVSKDNPEVSLKSIKVRLSSRKLNKKALMTITMILLILSKLSNRHYISRNKNALRLIFHQ